jgi:hypothetical protein
MKQKVNHLLPPCIAASETGPGMGLLPSSLTQIQLVFKPRNYSISLSHGTAWPPPLPSPLQLSISH